MLASRWRSWQPTAHEEAARTWRQGAGWANARIHRVSTVRVAIPGARVTPARTHRAREGRLHDK
jgi:hypothetical protein